MVNNLKWTSIASQEIEHANFRLEASVYNVEAKKAKEDLRNCKYPLKPLTGVDGLATAYHRLRFRRVFLEHSLMPIFQPSQISDINPKPELFISHLTKTNIDELRVHKDQILLTCSGTIGKCSLVSLTLDKQIFSHDLLRINAIDSKDIGLIYTYLKSKTGQTILITNNYGAVIQHIEPDHLNDYLIPYPDESIRSSLNNKIMASYDCRDRANKLMQQAELMLRNELKLPNLHEIAPTYLRKNLDIKAFAVPADALDDRFDASFHLPLINSIIDILLDNAKSITTLNDHKICSAVLHPERFKRVYVHEEHGVPFFGGKGLLSIDPPGKKYISKTKHSSRIPGLVLKENMILITRSGTIGKVNIVPRHWDGWIATDDLIRIIPSNDEIAGYLYVWLNSDFGKTIIEKYTYGSVVDHIEVSHVQNFIVPILKDKSVMSKINRFALEANKLRAEAYQLEHAAINQLNQEVIFARD